LRPALIYKLLLIVTLIVPALYTCPPAEASAFSVKVNRGRLTVKADEAPFGPLMDTIAKDAGFELTISADVATKKLSTEFRDLDLERGIQRLMGLIRHRNFFMFYGRDGNIKKIEIYGSSSGSGTSKPQPPSPGIPGSPGRRMVPMVIEPPTGSGSPGGQHVPGKVIGVPYIPPANLPEYIPPRRGIGGRSNK